MQLVVKMVIIITTIAIAPTTIEYYIYNIFVYNKIMYIYKIILLYYYLNIFKYIFEY
jgi:hypothetical protein